MIADSMKHPPGIVVEIVGTEMGCQGRSCDEHAVCSAVLEKDMVVCLRKVQVLVEGHEETAIACYWVTDGIELDFLCATWWCTHSAMMEHSLR
jgi:hypothetical protein